MAFRRPKAERKETGKPVAGRPSGVLYEPVVPVFAALDGVVNLKTQPWFTLLSISLGLYVTSFQLLVPFLSFGG